MTPNLARLLVTVAVVFASVFEHAAWGQGFTPQEAIQRLKVPDGLTATLFAHEPSVRQPILVKCDPRGRLWTIQYLQYPNPAGLKRVKVDRFSRTVYDRKPEPPPHGPVGADRITILEDRNHDGIADASRDFVTGLNLCTGLEFGYGGVFVIQVPYLLFYPDRNGDDIPDSNPEVLLDGFGMEDAQSLANHLTWGPDGWLYGLNGSTTTSLIKGIEFQQGVWRYHPRTKEFELFCEGGGNIFGLTFDRVGRLFYSSNGGVFWHGVQGASYEKNLGKHGPLHNPFAYGHFKNVVHQGETGRPNTGATIYQGISFPPQFRNTFMCGDFLSHTCSYWSVSPSGSTVKSKLGGMLVTSNDTWFGATDMCLGPDGAIYVCDFYDQRTGHPDPDARWDDTNGRIYRIQAKTAPSETIPNWEHLTAQELIDLLSNRNGWIAQRAQRVLDERNDAACIPPLRQKLFEFVTNNRDADDNDDTEGAALRCLWTLHAVQGLDETTAGQLLDQGSEHVRAWVVRLIGDRRTASDLLKSKLLALAQRERSPTVRLHLAAAARRLPADAGVPVLLALLADDQDESDPFLPLMVWWGLADHAMDSQGEIVTFFSSPAGWSTKLCRENQRRLIRRLATSGATTGYVACESLLKQTPANEMQPMLVALLAGLAERGRSMPGVGVAGLFENLAGARSTQSRPVERQAFAEISGPLRERLDAIWQQDPDRPTAIRLALEAKLPGISDHLARHLAQHTSSATQLEWLSILADYPQRECAEAIFAIIENSQDEKLTIAALGAAIPYINTDIARKWLKHFAAWPPRVQARASDVLFSRIETAHVLIESVRNKRIVAATIPLESLQKLSLLDDPEIDKTVRHIWGNIRPGTPEEKLAEIRRLTNDLRAGTGDRERGKVLFTKMCGTCHKLRDEGGTLGPDLSNTVKGDLHSLLGNIVDPSSVIKKEYLSTIIETRNGAIVTGLITADDGTSVQITDAKNQHTKISRDLIEDEFPADTSLMPERLLESLSPQELRDLFAYLRE